MTRVIHTADTHLGYRQYHAPERRADFLVAFEQVVDDAIASDVDAVVHAGDLFHDRRPELGDLQGTVGALARLRANEIPFLGVVGNHERKRDTQWLDLFEDLGLATHLSAEPTVIDGVGLYGLDYVTPARRERLDVAFETSHEIETAVLVAHGIITGFPHGDWALDELVAEADVAFDAVLLGDHHEHELDYRDGIPYTYPGSTERVSADERTERGYNIVELDGDISIGHRALPTRPFVFADIDLHADAGIEEVRRRLDQYDLADAVVIIDLHGGGQPIAPAAVERHAIDAGALVARVRDRRDQEGEEASTSSVSFADPDRSVRERLDDTPFSEAARELDGLVRDRSIPASHVRERVRERVRELLEESPESFEPTPPTTIDEDRATDAEDPDESVDAPDDTEHEEPDEPEETPVQDDGATAVARGAGQASMEDYL